MAVEKYMAKLELNGVAQSPTRCRDGMLTMPNLMMEVHEKEDGTVVAYALPPPREGEAWSSSEAGEPDLQSSTLQQVGNNVLAKRNMELSVENMALTALNKKLEEQNRGLMDRLMTYADRAMEKMYGEEPTARSSRSRSTRKKPGVSRSAEGSNGAETES